MLFVTRNFVVDRTAGALELMRQDGVTGLKRLVEAALVSVGPSRHVPEDRRSPGSSSSCRDFHPWNEDDRDLLRRLRGERCRDAAPAPGKKVRSAA